MFPQFTELYDCKICVIVLFYNVHHHAFHWCVLTLCTAVPNAFPEWACWQPVDIDIYWDLRFSQWCCLGCETLSQGRQCWPFRGQYMFHLQGQTPKAESNFLDCLTWWRHGGASKFQRIADWITQHHIQEELNLLIYTFF